MILNHLSKLIFLAFKSILANTRLSVNPYELMKFLSLMFKWLEFIDLKIVKAIKVRCLEKICIFITRNNNKESSYIRNET